MNEIWMTINGNAADAPKLWENDGRAFARVNVASTPRKFLEGQWQDGKTEWFQVKAWGPLAHNMAASIRKGDAVMVHGTFLLDEYTNDAGAMFKTAVIKASSVGFDLRRGCAMAVRRRTEVEEDGKVWPDVAATGEPEESAEAEEAAPVHMPEAV